MDSAPPKAALMPVDDRAAIDSPVAETVRLRHRSLGSAARDAAPRVTR